MNMNRHSFLLRWTSKFIKYFAWTLFGLLIAFVLSPIFGGLHIAISLVPFVLEWIVLRCGFILVCLVLITVIFESVR